MMTVRTLSFFLEIVFALRLVSPESCIGEFCFTGYDQIRKLNFDKALSWCGSQDFSPILAVVADNVTQNVVAQFLNSTNQELTYINIQLQQAGPSKSTWFLVNGSAYYGGLLNQDNSGYKLYGYLEIYRGAWNVIASRPDQNRSYICEFNETKCSQQEVKNSSSIRFKGRCYIKYETVNVTWYEARARCISEGGGLATFNYPDDQTANYSPPFNTSTLNGLLSYWVGIRWNNWSWISPAGSGNEIEYTHWSIGKPNNYYYTCVCLDPNGKPPWSWTDCDCSQERSYICLRRVPTTTTTTTTPSTTVTPSPNQTETLFNAASNPMSSDNAKKKVTLAIGLGVGIGGAFLILVIVVVVVLVIRRSKSRGKGKSAGILSNSGEPNTASHEKAIEDTDGGTYAVVVPNTQTKEAIKKEEVIKEAIYTIPVFEQSMNLSQSTDLSEDNVDGVGILNNRTNIIFSPESSDVYANSDN